MDRMIYVAMTGAKHVMTKQATTAQNIANVSTTGFRAQMDAFRSVPVLGAEKPTRTYVVDSTVGSDFSAGGIQQTGRALDVAVQGKGWIAVQMVDGSEAYTRNGSFKLSENGVLQSEAGLSIMGDGGPISIPPDVHVSVAKDGTVSAIDTTSTPATVNVLGRIKLVNPSEANLVRGEDGLFRTRDGVTPQADENVALHGGALESSNVNAAEAIVDMISLARQFEMHMNLIKNAEENEAKATQLLSIA